MVKRQRQSKNPESSKRKEKEILYNIKKLAPHQKLGRPKGSGMIYSRNERKSLTKTFQQNHAAK